MKNIIYSILVLVTFLSLPIIYANQQTSVEQINELVVTNNKINDNIVLYFPEIDDLKLVKKEVKVNGLGENKVEYIIKELLNGPEEENLMDIIPYGTKLNSAYIKNNIAFIDFSKEFITNHPGGSWGEYSTIYGIVNSLCELEDVDSVQFLIDGKIVDEFKGHININKPLEKSDDN